MSNLALHTTRFHHLLRRMRSPLTHFTEQRALGRYTILGDRLLSQLVKDRQGEFQSTSPRIVQAIRTRSDVAILLVSEAPANVVTKVLKLPLTVDAEASTTRHRQVVAALHELPQLLDFNALVPHALAWGTFEGQPYYLETAIAGVAASDLVRRRAEPSTFKQTAVHAIHQLHAATLRRQTIDDEVFADLAANDLALLYQLAEHSPQAALLRTKLHSLETTLRHEFYGRDLPFGWSHGDYWPGNIMLDPGKGSLCGIVDWDRALPQQIPLLDVLHLLAFTRKMQQRSELGEVIVTYLLPNPFDVVERRLIDDTLASLNLPRTFEFLQAAILLYWLRFAAANLSRYPAFQKDQRWLYKNVFNVLKRDVE